MRMSDVMKRLPSTDEMVRLAHLNSRYGETKGNLSESIEDPKDFFLCYFASAQQKAVEIESFITSLLGGKKVSASIDRGDCQVGDEFFELKTSTTNQSQSLNIRQIRLWQDVDYYICSYIDEKNLSNSAVFRLSKEQMVAEVALMGGYCHGTKAASDKNVNAEYGIVVQINRPENENNIRWRRDYWDEELYQALIDTGTTKSGVTKPKRPKCR